MRKIIVRKFVSLDGVIQAPCSADEDRRADLTKAVGPGHFGMMISGHIF